MIIREKKARETRKLEKAAIVVQKHYRGHRGRVLTRLQMKGNNAIVKKKFNSAVKIQSWARGVDARFKVEKMYLEKKENMMTDARLWTETWSEDANTWFYHNSQTDEALWEPPTGGYTKADGRLVLKSGKVIDDPFKAMTVEEKEAKVRFGCVWYDDERGMRFINPNPNPNPTPNPFSSHRTRKPNASTASSPRRLASATSAATSTAPRATRSPT